MNKKILLLITLFFVINCVFAKKTTEKTVILTIEELKQYDGNNTEKKYIAFKGAIYDISSNKLWNNSKYIKNGAGIDLTDIISDDSVKLFKKSLKVGKLVKGFTIKELSKYNGKNKMPSYVAVNGIVYDVSNYRLWKNGKHMGQHTAGVDLTKAFKRSPHNKKFLLRLPIVGKIIKKTKTKNSKAN